MADTLRLTSGHVVDLPPCGRCTIPRPTGPGYIEGNPREAGFKLLLYGYDIAGHVILAASMDDGWIEVYVYGTDGVPVPCDSGDHQRTAIVPMPIVITRH